MDSMRRGTTPPVTLKVNADITAYTVYVTMKTTWNKLTITNDRLTMRYADGKTYIAFSLTQEETLAFSIGRCEVQIRAVDSRGIAKASNIKPIEINRIIQEGVIHE